MLPNLRISLYLTIIVLSPLFRSTANAQQTEKVLEESMANCLTAEGEMDLRCAADVFKKIVDIAEKEYGTADERYLEHLTTCTLLMLQNNDVSTAKPYADKVLDLTAQKHGGASDEYLEKLSIITQLLMVSSDPAIAKPFVINFLSLLAEKKGSFSSEYQEYKAFVVQTYQQNGDQAFADAIEQESAQVIQHKIYSIQQEASSELQSKHRSPKGKTFEELIQAGSEYFTAGNYRECRKYFGPALEMMQGSKKTNPDDYMELLYAYYNSLLMEEDSPEKERELEVFLAKYQKDFMLIGMAQTWEEDEDDPSPIDMRSLMFAFYGEDEEADSLLESSNASAAKKRSTRMIMESIKTSKKIDKVKEDLIIFEYPNLLDTAAMYVGQRSFDKKASQWIDRSIEQIQPSILNRLGETQQFAILEKLQINAEANLNYIAKAVGQHPELAAKAYNQSLRLKGLSLVHQKRVRALAKEVKSAKVKMLYKKIQEAQNQLNAIYASGKENAYRKSEEVRALIFEKGRLEEELYQLDEMQFKEALNQDWKQVQKELKKGEAAIEMLRFVYREDGLWTDQVKYVALIVRPEYEWPKWVYLPNGNDLEEKHFQTYQNSRNLSYNANSPVYQHYWSDIQQHLKGVQQVYFSPDGIYHLINLNTIPDPRHSDKYLLDAFSITMVNSTRSIGEQKTNHSTAKTAVLFGNPDYAMPLQHKATKENVSKVGNESRQWSLLPQTEDEVKNISTFLKKNKYQTSVYTEKTALEEAIRDIAHPNILHLATHGFFAHIDYSNLISVIEEDEVGHKYPSTNGIIGVKPGTNIEDFFSEKQIDAETYARIIDTLSINQLWLKPELNTGLVFAGANDDHQLGAEANDGILYGSEVSLLDLRETELVVLSACESGQGQLSIIQGISGLKRAFQTAGAENIIISLWKVNDEVTQQFMSLFYQNWIEGGLSKEAAFRKTQQQIRDEYYHEEPRYWGAFVLIKN